MSWSDIKNSKNQIKANLDTVTTNGNIETIVTEMNNAIFRFTSNAGISSSQDNNTDYQTANTKFSQLTSLQDQYISLNNDLTKQIRIMTDNTDIKNKLSEVGRLKNNIVELEKELVIVKQEADTSLARQISVDKPREDLSMYQGFSGKIGFTRPLRKMSIPLMVAFGLLFLFFSGLMLKEFFATPTSTYINNSTYEIGGLFSVFTDARFYSVLMGILLVAIVVGILSYKGVFGSKLN